MSTVQETDWVESIGKPTYSAIREMVRALDIETAAEDYAADLERGQCVELLESVGIECKDEEAIETLREAVAVNIADGTIEDATGF